MRSPLGQLLDVAYTIEYGADSSEQSSLNLLYLLGYRGQGQLRIFGASNEKYHVVGGNDQIPSALAERLAGQITVESVLVAIALRADGSYSLAFRQGSTTRTVAADRVILALPFSILRSSVDISKAGFSERKRTAIRDLGMGTNSKLHLQFKTRHWNSLDCNGETFADTGYQNTWEVTRAQRGTAGILVNYTGGKIGASFGSETATGPAGVPPPARPGAARDHEAVEPSGHPRLLAGLPWTKARTRTGRSVSTRHSPVSKASERELPLRR